MRPISVFVAVLQNQLNMITTNGSAIGTQGAEKNDAKLYSVLTMCERLGNSLSLFLPIARSWLSHPHDRR